MADSSLFIDESKTFSKISSTVLLYPSSLVYKNMYSYSHANVMQF